MAPEQMQLARASARRGGFAYPTTSNTDQFSFCVSLHEALCGEPPFAGDNLLAIFENVRAGRIRTPAAARSLPRHLRRALERGLSLKPGDRFESRHALLAALDNASRARARRMAIGAGALGLLVAAVGAVELRAKRPVLCPSAAPELAGVWDDARESSLTKRATITYRAALGLGSSLPSLTPIWRPCRWRQRHREPSVRSSKAGPHQTQSSLRRNSLGFRKLRSCPNSRAERPWVKRLRARRGH
jgi:hypothetical protein